MHPLEERVFDEIYKEMSWEPEVVIYVRTDPDVCMKRIKTRSRDCESKISMAYLQNLHDKYEQLAHDVKHKPNVKLYVIDGNNTQDEVYDDAMVIINQLKARYSYARDSSK